MRTFLSILLLIFAPLAFANEAEPVADFALPDVEGQSRGLSEFDGQLVVLEWTNFQCPCVKKHYDSRKMQLLQSYAGSKEVAWLTICSSPEGAKGYFNAQLVNKIVDGIGAKPTAYLCDAEGKVAQQFGVKFTPHMVILGKDRTVLYSGTVSNEKEVEANPDAKPVDFFQDALDAVLSGKSTGIERPVQVGCPIPMIKPLVAKE
ncbi:MAG: hypothetical protein ACI8W8_003354 [Rhodothermales bacterium]|jgi:hypothetical protein